MHLIINTEAKWCYRLSQVGVLLGRDNCLRDYNRAGHYLLSRGCRCSLSVHMFIGMNSVVNWLLGGAVHIEA